MALRRNRLIAKTVASASMLVVLLAALPQARAGVVAGASQGYNASVNLTANVLNTSTPITYGPSGLAQGTAPSPYSASDSLASFNVGPAPTTFSIGIASVTLDPLTIQSAGLQDSASSNVDGTAGAKSATASSQSTNGFVFELLKGSITSILGTQSFVGLSVTAAAITSTAAVSGDYGSLAATSSVVVQDLLIKSGTSTIYSYSGTLSPQSFNISLPSILGGGSLTLDIGQSATTGDGISSRGIATDFLSLTLDDVGIKILNTNVATLDGTITIGHAEASLGAVPEPSSIALFGVAGLVLLIPAARQMKRTA